MDYMCQYGLHSNTTCGVGYVYDLPPIKTHTPKSNGSLVASVEPKVIKNIHTFTNLNFICYKKLALIKVAHFSKALYHVSISGF